jgi:glutathione synthase
MSVRLGIVMDPIANISFKKGQLAGHAAGRPGPWLELFYMEQRDLYQGEPGTRRVRA